MARHLRVVVYVFIWVYPWNLLLGAKKTGHDNTHVKPITLWIQNEMSTKGKPQSNK